MYVQRRLILGCSIVAVECSRRNRENRKWTRCMRARNGRTSCGDIVACSMHDGSVVLFSPRTATSVVLDIVGRSALIHLESFDVCSCVRVSKYGSVNEVGRSFRRLQDEGSAACSIERIINKQETMRARCRRLRVHNHTKTMTSKDRSM